MLHQYCTYGFIFHFHFLNILKSRASQVGCLKVVVNFMHSWIFSQNLALLKLGNMAICYCKKLQMYL